MNTRTDGNNAPNEAMLSYIQVCKLTQVGRVPPRGRRPEQIARRHVDAVDEVEPAGERATRGERLGLVSQFTKLSIPSVE